MNALLNFFPLLAISDEPAVLAAISALAAAVTALWLWVAERHKELTKRALECEEDREKMWTRIAELERISAHNEAVAQQPCPAGEGCPKLPPSMRKTQSVTLPKIRYPHLDNPSAA